MATITEVGQIIADQLDITPEAGTDTAGTYLAQINDLDHTHIPDDEIPQDTAEFIIEAARQGMLAGDLDDDQGLDDLTELSDRLAATQSDEDMLAADRNRLLLQLLEGGETIPHLVAATGLNRSRIYAIRDQARRREATA